MALAFVLLGDGLAMLLPGPTSAVGGLALMLVGLMWLVLAMPRLLSTEGRPFTAILVARFGLLMVPPLGALMAGIWWLSTPEALSRWFAVAWGVVWAGCVGLSAVVRCPSCGHLFSRRGLRFEVASSSCPHCGANPRGGVG